MRPQPNDVGTLATLLPMALLALSATAAAQSTSPVRVRQSFDANGTLVTITEPDPQTLADPPLFRADEFQCIRWIDSAPPTSWIPWQIALGDRGASVAVWGNIMDRHVSVYSGGSSDAAFALESGPWDGEALAAAARSASIARVSDRLDEATGERHVFVEMFADHANGAALWSYEFPFYNEDISPAPSVLLSRTGDRLTAITGRFRLGGADTVWIRTFDKDGSLRSALRIDDTAFHGAADASDDGRVLALTVLGWPRIIDTDTGTLEFTEQGKVSKDMAVSGDGRRVAWGGAEKRDSVWEGRVVVVERDSAGQWQRLRTLSLPRGIDGTEVTQLDMNADGSRLAFVLQDFSFTRFTTLLYDVDRDIVQFERRNENLHTALQLYATDVEIDDAGETVAVTSWGDSDDLTAQAQCFDSSGLLLCGFHTRGSALDLELTPDGEHFCVAATTGHANTGMRSGDVYYGSTRQEALRIHGLPRAGEPLLFEVQEPAADTVLFLAVADERLVDSVDALELDLSSLLVLYGPNSGIAGSERTVPPGLAGFDLHFQGLYLAVDGSIEFSNTETIRFIE